MIRIRTCRVLAFGASILAAAPAFAVDDVRACRETAARVGAGLVGKILHMEQACLRKIARGRLPAGARCVGSGGDLGAITVAPVRTALQRAVDAARATLQGKCGTIDPLAPPPAGLGMPATCPAIAPSCMGAITNADEAIACQLCADVSAAHYVLGVQYPGADATPDPNVPTPTPTATPHAGGGPVVVSFEIDAATRLAGFKFDVGYPGAKGAFRGTAQFVDCVSDTAFGFFLSNHKANEDNLITLIATAGVLGLPTTIACTFDVASHQTLAPEDLTITVDETVDADGSSGDPQDLTVTASVVDHTAPCLGGTAIVAVDVDHAFTDLALTIGYPPSLVAVPGSGAVDARVGVAPALGSSLAEDVDTGVDGIDDAVRITYAGTQAVQSGLFAEVHFDCVQPLTAADLASFTCTVDSVANGASEVSAGCTVSRIGFPSSLP